MTWRSVARVGVFAALGLSLALNVFMFGYAAHGLRQGAETRALVREIAADYPARVRQEFRAVMRENRPRTIAALRDLREARAELAAAINATPFDAAAVETAMTKVREATGNMQATLQDHLLTAVRRVRENPEG